MKSARVIGSGFTGMMAAYFLSKRGFSVTVIDEQPQPGGMIQTIPHQYGDAETAANGFLSTALLEEIADQIQVKLVPASPLAKKNRWLYPSNSKEPKKWPLTLLETLVLGWRVFWRLIRGQMAPKPEETLEDWGVRTLGQAATTKILQIAVLGIYACPISELSATLVLGKFFQKSSSKKRKPKKRGTVAPESGMSQWFTQMKLHLEMQGVTFQTARQPLLQNQDLLNFQYTFICTSASEAARLLTHTSPETASILNSVEMLPIVSVTGISSQKATHFRGFGCLFHPHSGFSSLGALWSSDIFPHRFPSTLSCETWILGGQVHPQIIHSSDSEILEKIYADRARLGRPERFVHYYLKRWPRAFPKYSVSLEKSLGRLPRGQRSVILCGNYLGSLGLSQIAQKVHDTVKELP